jgi:diguanylate cyclase (GGDEF)-like protein
VEARDVELEIEEQAAKALGSRSAQERARAIARLAELALQQTRAHERAKALVITDEHTRLYNARHLRHTLGAEVERAKRFDHVTSLIFLDLDRFKAINDKHGHLAGSAVLAEVGERLLGSIRRIDSAFRFGGDEFVLLLVETNRAGAHVVAERVRKRIESEPFLTSLGLEVRVTASLGVASFPDDSTTADLLLEGADSAMYRAKDAGRNCVRPHSI